MSFIEAVAADLVNLRKRVVAYIRNRRRLATYKKFSRWLNNGEIKQCDV